MTVKKKEETDDEILAAWLGGEEPDDPNKDKKPEDEDTPSDSHKKEEEEEDDDPPVPGGPISARVKMMQSESDKDEDKSKDKGGEDEDDKSKNKGEGEEEEDDDDKNKKVSFRIARQKKESRRQEQQQQDHHQQKKNSEEEDDDKGPLSEDEMKEVKSLPPEMQQGMSFWLDAESIGDEQYKGRAKEYLDYARAYKAKVAELKEDDPDFDPQNSPELAQWIRSQDRPEARQQDIRTVERELIKRDLAKENAQKEAEQQRKIRAIEEKPRIEKEIDKFQDSLSDVVPEDVRKVFASGVGESGDSEAGLEAVADEYGDEVANLIRRNYEDSVGTADAWLSVTRGVENFDPNNPHHTQANQLAIHLGQQILSNPKLEHLRTKDGKTFVPREKFFQLPPEEQANSFTLDDNDVLNYIRARAKTQISTRIEDAKKREEDRFRRRMKKRGVQLDASETRDDDPPDPPPTRQPSNGGKGGEGNDALSEFFVAPPPR